MLNAPLLTAAIDAFKISYITAQIIMQIMQPAIPQLQAIAKEGEGGRQ